MEKKSLKQYSFFKKKKEERNKRRDEKEENVSHVSLEK
jgi:hypothetical protein